MAECHDGERSIVVASQEEQRVFIFHRASHLANEVDLCKKTEFSGNGPFERSLRDRIAAVDANRPKLGVGKAREEEGTQAAEKRQVPHTS